ncbi:TPA: hypothetical protein ACGBG5_003437 [Enterococcus faecalis]
MNDTFFDQLAKYNKRLDIVRKNMNSIEKSLAPVNTLMKQTESKMNPIIEQQKKFQQLLPDFSKILKNVSATDIYYDNEDAFEDAVTIDGKLSSMSQKEKFSNEDKEQLLLLADFFAEQGIYKPEELIQYFDSVTCSSVETIQKEDNKAENIPAKPGNSDVKEDSLNIQNGSQPFLKQYFSKEKFFNELSSYLYQAFFDSLVSVIRGDLDIVFMLILIRTISLILKIRI